MEREIFVKKFFYGIMLFFESSGKNFIEAFLKRLDFYVITSIFVKYLAKYIENMM